MKKIMEKKNTKKQQKTDTRSSTFLFDSKQTLTNKLNKNLFTACLHRSLCTYDFVLPSYYGNIMHIINKYLCIPRSWQLINGGFAGGIKSM